MKKSVLLSLFVFPGFGHFYLKKYITATLLSGIAFIALFFLMGDIFQRATTIVHEILAGNIGMNIDSIRLAITQQETSTIITTATYIFISCWVISVIDAYRIEKSLQL